MSSVLQKNSTSEASHSRPDGWSASEVQHVYSNREAFEDFPIIGRSFLIIGNLCYQKLLTQQNSHASCKATLAILVWPEIDTLAGSYHPKHIFF